MIKPGYVLSILIFAFGCGQINTADRKITNDSSTTTHLKTVPDHAEESFDQFFKKFDTDSVFQHSRIEFPLKYESLDDEGDPNTISYISKSDLPHIGLNKLKEPKMMHTKKITDSSKIEMKFVIEDTGYEKKLVFEKKGEKWFLFAVSDLSD
ncbi:DUF4348 domain-containing protein [Pedobacter sp. UBA5917]|jgi:hypothetical protein|uniref:DUF4348 domain-containing protein n=1 Tax=Pedobacter sp. UBA5917 TaxID=1947061 RepID=UPI0025CCF5FC|nr:DUF4348 domain-containing protein [Pedobacter sp. UBA5917]